MSQQAAAVQVQHINPGERKFLIQRQLALLHHARKCENQAYQSSSETRQCSIPHCSTMKDVLHHLATCQAGNSCAVPHCSSSRQILSHWKNCAKLYCHICVVFNLPHNLWPKHPDNLRNADEEGADDSGMDSDETEEMDEEEVDEESEEDEEDILEGCSDTLKMASDIFKRQETDSSESALFLVVLAESHIKSGDYPAAIRFFKSCLAYSKMHLKSDDKFLADIYYQMGLVQLSTKQYHEALKTFQTAKSILNLRLENLKNIPVEAVCPTCSSALEDTEAEVSDLEMILLDIQEKIEDTEELICNTTKELEDAFASRAQI